MYFTQPLFVTDIFLPHVVRDTAGHHMHSVRVDVDETVERSESWWSTAVGRKSTGEEASDPNGRGSSGYIRFLLVSDSGECGQKERK